MTGVARIAPADLTRLELQGKTNFAEACISITPGGKPVWRIDLISASTAQRRSGCGQQPTTEEQVQGGRRAAPLRISLGCLWGQTSQVTPNGTTGSGAELTINHIVFDRARLAT